MKKLKMFIYTILISLFFLPCFVNALTDNTGLKMVNESAEIDIGSFSIDDISYINSDNETFGVKGNLINDYDNTIQFLYQITYYSSEKEIIYEVDGTSFFKSQCNLDFIKTSELGELNGRTIDDIVYYSVGVEINELENTTSGEFVNQDNNSDYLKPSSLSEYSSKDFVIDSYDVNIVVNEDNSLDIIETIGVYFNEYKHGIYRNIPLKNKIKRNDGTTSENSARISNVYVNDEFKKYSEDGNYVIKIGSESTTNIGEKSYVIKYTYNLGRDPLKGNDEFYYNLIGTEWTTAIGGVTFTITMPKEFDKSTLGFTSGVYGSTNTDNISYQVDGKVITGSYDGILSSGEGLTVRLTLEEGYFEYSIDKSFILMIAIPLSLLIISWILWYFFGKDKHMVETVEFYPPDDLNSLDISFLYNGHAKDSDVVSLLIYLANKGYVKIEEYEKKGFLSFGKDFKIIKVKDYDGDNELEKIFFDGLFTIEKNVVSMKELSSIKNMEDLLNVSVNEVTSDDLYDNFYKTLELILKIINNKEHVYSVFEKKSMILAKLIILFAIISFITVVTIPTLAYANIEMVFATLIISVFYLPFCLALFNKNVSVVLKIVLGSFIGFHALCFFSALPIKTALVSDIYFLVAFVVGIICIILMIVCHNVMLKRTDYGLEMLGKIKGFKNFLETAEKENLEAMVMQDPEYFYNILPYTYVLGISDKWIEKFEAIALKAPEWYGSDSGSFDVRSFGDFMNNTMSNATSSMSSSPSSSSGGGSSGGGSSGGGSGGGGGGSW